ncbi:MAG: DUF58 domain-containing protein, partial [Pseudomonadota bacterium]
MIAPSLRAIWLMLLGLPIMLVIAVVAPSLWALSLGWLALVGALLLVDLSLAARRGAIRVEVSPPALLYTNSEDPVHVT